MSANIDVSVIVPMYQSAGTVRATLESALADFDASRVSGEVVVVNDGSTDEGPAIVEAIARRDVRVRAVHRNNGGLAAARNTGIAQARGRFLRFLDADDLAAPGGLAWLLGAADQAGAACGAQELIDEGGVSMGRELSPRTGADRTIGLEQLVTGNAMGVGTVLVSRELLGTARFDESLPVCEDWDLWLRLAGDGVRFAALPAWRGPVKRYRVRAGSLSKRFALMNEVGARVLGRLDDVDVCEGLVGLAGGYGTMLALAGGGDVEGGLEMLRAYPVRRLGAGSLATDAFSAVVLGLGQRPEQRGTDRERWVMRLVAWWARLAEDGWADAMAVEAAWRELARLVVSPGAAAAACAKQVRAVGARSAVVVGLGKNGRRVAEALSATGTAWLGRDEGMTGREGGEGGMWKGRWEPMGAPIAPGAAVIVTPERDEALLGAIAGTGVGGDRVIRWREVLANLGAMEEGNLAAAAERCARDERPRRRCA